MKKAKIIVPAIALLALGVAGSTLGTVAWFQTNATATVSAGTPATGSVKSSTTTAEVGSFTVTPVLETAITESSVVLSDANGDVYVENNGNKIKVNDQNAIAATYVTASVKFTIAYSGSLSQASEILTLWNASAGSNYKVTVTDTTAYADGVPSAAIVSWLSGDGASAIRGTGFGLKFKQAAAPARSSNGWANEWDSATHSANKLEVGNLALTNPGSFSVSGSAGSYTATVTTAVKATIYVGIVGIDGVAQTSTDAYSMNFAVSGGSIA